MLVPSGDFVLSVPGETATQQLMGGLQGMEYFAFTPAAGKVPGDRLRFVANSPAYAPLFPFPLASPTAAPFDPTASPLTSIWTTAYATCSGSRAGGEPDGRPESSRNRRIQLFGVGGTVNPSAHPEPARFGGPWNDKSSRALRTRSRWCRTSASPRPAVRRR